MYTGKRSTQRKTGRFVHTAPEERTMKPPAGKRLKTSDIAEITGLSEEKIRDLASRNSNRIPSQKMGRIHVYDEKAATIFTTIAQEEGNGKISLTSGLEEKSGASVKERGITDGPSRLGSISKTREKEEKTAKAKAGETYSAGRVPTQLINTVAMQGQQFSRFADRLTALENTATADREASTERVERLERQIAALQEQMESVDSWIQYSDHRLDAGDAQIKGLAEETQTWTEYVRHELAYLRLSWWKRRQQK